MPTEYIATILIYTGIFFVWFFLSKILYDFILTWKQKELDKRIDDTTKQAREIIEKAEKQYQEILKTAQVETEKRIQNVEKIEERVLQKEEKLEAKLEWLEKEKEKIYQKQEEADKIILEQKNILTHLSGLSPDEAKTKLFDIIEQENKTEIVNFINKFKSIKQEEAQKEACDIIARVLPRVGMTEVNEFTLTTVDIPSEETKWKIIWREWRNISFFERVTWVELIIDDTPMVVKLSSYDPEKRYVASETLKKLLKDWRINPVYIEKYHKEISLSLGSMFLDKWKQALSDLNLSMMKPEIVQMIWQYYLRYSYGQNLLTHSIEVARLSEMLANELWLDWVLAKKAWLLHDIWKLTSVWNWEWHAKLGWDILRQYWFDDVVVNAAEAHHFDIPLTHPISRIVAAADAISAGRPWARFNTKDFFTERMWNLEKLIMSLPWVDKTFIMQAGREIMVFVNPETIDDLNMEKLVKEVWEKIESQLDYPWAIRVVAIRESKVAHYLR